MRARACVWVRAQARQMVIVYQSDRRFTCNTKEKAITFLDMTKKHCGKIWSTEESQS